MDLVTPDGRRLRCEGRTRAWPFGLSVVLQFSEEGRPVGRFCLQCLSSDPGFSCLRDLDDDALVQKAMERIDEWLNHINETVLQLLAVGGVIYIRWPVPHSSAASEFIEVVKTG
jgi:hypothetical protein